ncbi:MAG: hypothetical protein AAF573_10300 [Bacteroidota bacterium]
MKRNLKSMAIIFVVLTFLDSCTDSVSSKNKSSNSNVFQSTVEINEWQMDSLGCKRLRTKELAERMIFDNNLESKAMSDFKKIFGRPNKEEIMKGEVIISYYFNALCRNNEFLDTADYCIAEFRFIQDVFTKQNYICL